MASICSFSDTQDTSVTVTVAWVCHAIVQTVCTFQAGDDSAYRLLFSSYQGGQPILDRGRTEVFQMSAFEHDQSAEAQKCMIGDIRRAIEQGKTCFLMYTEPIHGSLYDLFNQFFTVQRDRDQNAKLYVKIGIGSYSKVTSNVCMCSLHSCLVCKARLVIKWLLMLIDPCSIASSVVITCFSTLQIFIASVFTCMSHICLSLSVSFVDSCC